MHTDMVLDLKKVPRFLEAVGAVQANTCADRIKQRSTYRLPLSGEGPHLSVAGTAGGIHAGLVGPAELSVFSLRPHARIQQEGGTILPKTGKALAIPLTDELRKSGLWPRHLDPDRSQMQFIPVHGANPNVIGILVPKEPKSGKGKRGKRRRPGVRASFRKKPFTGKALYVLVKQTQIKAQPYLYWDEADMDRAVQLLGVYVEAFG